MDKVHPDPKLPVPDSKLIIFTLSDSSGETAEAVAKAALVQFSPEEASIYRLPQVRSVQQISLMVRELGIGHSVIAYTLVLPEYREALEAEAKRYDIPTVDLLGPLISRIAKLTGSKPLSEPGRLHLLDESYFRRIEAVDFAIRFDDGKSPEGILKADVILTGVSRTSKTPNSMYLAHHYGLKAANIPIVLGVAPPSQLYQVNSRKIIGLHIDPALLQEIRIAGAQARSMPAGTDYANLEKIRQEVRYAKQVFRELKCHVIDMTAKAIEETSSEIFLYLRQYEQSLSQEDRSTC